jgi:peptidoglycan/xylan/chitin deacetylase (PgdA/CDA1 family)
MTAARDFEGYGPVPPHADWPHGARLALNIVINVEEGAEPSVQDGDATSETGLIDAGPAYQSGRDLAAESMFEYGSRAGFWRLLRLLQRFKLPATFFACSQALERNPKIAAAIREGIAAGIYDTCAHGLRWELHRNMTPEAERRAIHKAYDDINKLTGAPPGGWYCRYGPSDHTRAIVAAHGGFGYDSDSYNDDLPYWVSTAQGPHLVVPYSLAVNDGKVIRGSIATGADFERMLTEQLEFLVDEGATSPKMMSIGLHCRLAGHPFRAHGLARFLDALTKRRDVWVCRRGDIARHWRERHPAGARK